MTLKRSVSVLLVVVGVIAVLIVAAVGVTRTGWFRQWLADRIEQQGERYLTGDLSIGRVEGDLVNGIELRDVRVTQDGDTVIRAERIRASYNLRDLFAGRLALPELVVERPVIRVTRKDGELNVANLLEPRPAGGPAAAFSLGRLQVIDGTVLFSGIEAGDAFRVPDRLEDVDATLSIDRRAAGSALTVDLDALSFRSRNPDLSVERASGEVTVSAGSLIALEGLTVRTAESTVGLDGTINLSGQTLRLNLQVKAPRLDTGELSRAIPALEPLEISPSLTASVRGPLDSLAVDFDMNSDRGRVSGTVTADASGPVKAVKGAVDAADVDLSAFSELEKSDITAEGRIDLQFDTRAGETEVSGTYDLEIPEFAYGEYRATDVDAEGRIDARRIKLDVGASTLGGRVAAKGTIELPRGDAAATFDLEGQVADVDPGSLPEGLIETPIRPEGRASLDFRVSGTAGDLDADVRFHDFSLAGAEFEKGTRVQLTRRQGRLQYAIDGAVSALDPRRLAEELGSSALSNPRYAGDVNARVNLKGSGTSPDTLSLQGTAALTDSELFGGVIPSMTLTFDLTRGAGTVTARGNFDEIDLDRIAAANQLHGTLSGMIDLTAELPSRAGEAPIWQNMTAAGQILVTSGTISGVRVDRAMLAGTVDDGVATITRFDATGPDLRLESSGTLALNQTGNSDFTYIVDTPPLQLIEAIDAPVQGELLLKGRVEGNLDELRMLGTFAGTQIGYGDVRALAADGTYDVRVSDFQLTGVAVAAAADATLLRVNGWEIDEVTADLRYDHPYVTFATELQQRERSLAAEGRLLWQANRQRVELARLAVRSGEGLWQIAPGGKAIVDYGDDRLAIDQLRLEGAGGQMLSVDGVLGGTGAGLEVTAENVRLSQLDALLELNRQLQGELDARINVTGSLNDPSAEGSFDVTGGAVEQFAYDSLAGTFDYADRLIGLDARLTTPGGGYLDASGRVPFGDKVRAPMDLRIDSSTIGLGLVQGLTDEITDVTGSVQVQMHATGTLRNPELNGFVEVTDGAFTLALAQSHYTGLDTRVVFDGEMARLETFTLLDDEQHPLQVSGHVMTLGGRPREFALVVQSDQFEIMDNRFGELEVAADLRVSGELTRPRITGTAEIEAGTIYADDLLEVLYATGALGRADVPPFDARGQTPAEPPIAVTADIRLLLADAIVVNGTDLPAPGGLPIGMGDVNLTIGGQLHIEKPPVGRMTVVGDIHAVRGTYEFQGREFEVMREGSIRFTGGELDPVLNLTAQREISSVLTRVQLQGTLSKPALQLSSQPPLDDGEILSLIVFNQPLNALGADQQVSLARQALGLAAGLLTDRVVESLADELELDILELELVDNGGVVPAVTIGEQFADGVYIKVRQQLGSQAASALLLEYELDDWVRLVARFAEEQGATENLFNRMDRGRIALEFTFRY